MVENYPILTLVPPLLAIVLVVATRKVLLSLGLGVVSAALLIEGFSPWATVKQVAGAFTDLFWLDGELNTTKVYILVFTLMLGVITAFIMMSGGTRAFADWAQERIKTRRGATMLPAALGVAIFVDDYFNALAVGQVSRPVTDTHRVSRAKLAYIVDSTSAPVAVLVPFSSWGAFILGLIGTEVAASSLETSDVGAFVQAAGANYYAFAALLLVGVVATTSLDLGPMRAEERRAIMDGQPFDGSEEIPGQLAEDLPVHRPGAKLALIMPFVIAGRRCVRRDRLDGPAFGWVLVGGRHPRRDRRHLRPDRRGRARPVGGDLLLRPRHLRESEVRHEHLRPRLGGGREVDAACRQHLDARLDAGSADRGARHR